MQFFVKDSATNLGIDSAKVDLRKTSDGSLVFSGTTDSSGLIDLPVAVDIAYTVLAYKTGAYDGARLSVIQHNSVLLPSGMSLIKVQNRLLKVAGFIGTTSHKLVEGGTLVVKRADGTVFDSGLLDLITGKRSVMCPADLTGWTALVTLPGYDGVSFPMDKIDLAGEVMVILGPVIAGDE